MKTIEDKKIYIDFPRKRTIKTYMVQLLKNKILYKKETYLNKKRTKLECSCGRNRSVSAFYNIVKTEYKSCTLEKFLEIYGQLIHKLVIQDEYTLALYYCNDIHKFIVAISNLNHINTNSNTIFKIHSGLWRYKEDLKDNTACTDGFTVKLLTKLMKYNELHKI
jgi:hypothetical protein